jgi:hypothetical protein
MNVPLLVILAAAAVLVAAGLVVVLLVVLGTRRRLESALVSSRADVDALRQRLEDLSRRVPADPQAPEPEPHDASGREYLITTLPDGGRPRTAVAVPDPEPVGERLTAGEFASVAVGESLVRVLSFGYGVRRALSAENRSRIRFEIRREVKRSRKQRRRDLKEAKRHLRDEQRVDLAEDAAA